MLAVGTLIAAATLSVATPTTSYRRASDSARPAQVASKDVVKGKRMLDLNGRGQLVHRPGELHASSSPTGRAPLYFLSLGR
jgi:hypothetical protein